MKLAFDPRKATRYQRSCVKELENKGMKLVGSCSGMPMLKDVDGNCWAVSPVKPPSKAKELLRCVLT